MTSRPARNLLFGSEARLALLRGANRLVDTVQPTLGPAGRSVIIERPFAKPIIARNGYAIAKHVHLADPMENMGVRAVREVAWRTSDEVGDGTTTAMVLTRAMVAEGVKAASMGMNPRQLQLGFDRASEVVLHALERLSRPAESDEQITQVGTLATGGDREMGAMLGDAVARVGVDGFVLVEDGHGRASQLDVREGMHLDQGYVSAHFVTDEEQMLVEMEDPYILLHLGKITDLGAVVPALNAFAKADKPLLFIAEDITGEALSALVVNKLKAGFKVAAAKAPGFGTWRQPMLEDIAIATGGQVVANDLGTTLENLKPEMLGRAQRVRIGKDSTTIINGAGKPEDIEFRVRQLRAAIEREKHLSYDREQLQQRLARLVSGIAVVRVGGATDTEIDERKERVTAAVHTARAAVTEGLVVGGGAALVHASKALDRLRPENDDEHAAIKIVRAALAAPACCIADNLGVDGRWAVAQLLDTDDPCQGFDASTGRLGDLFEAGIIDATKVVATACRNAASTAARIVTSEAAIAPLEELKA